MTWAPAAANPAVGSFLPYLRWAVEYTDGPILELGTGYFSTPYLNGEFIKGRDVWCYEFDPVWAEEVRSRYTVLLTTSPDGLPDKQWDVVLIDCEGWSRYPFLDSLRVKTKIFVLHDSQDPWISEEVLNSFKYRKDFDEDPRTTLVSDVVDVREAL